MLGKTFNRMGQQYSVIYSTDIFHSHLSLLFSVLLRHGCLPEGMLLGTMVPLPKGRRNNFSNSKNFKALTINSLLEKVLDNKVSGKKDGH